MCLTGGIHDRLLARPAQVTCSESDVRGWRGQPLPRTANPTSQGKPFFSQWVNKEIEGHPVASLWAWEKWGWDSEDWFTYYLFPEASPVRTLVRAALWSPSSPSVTGMLHTETPLPAGRAGWFSEVGKSQGPGWGPNRAVTFAQRAAALPPYTLAWEVCGSCPISGATGLPNCGHYPPLAQSYVIISFSLSFSSSWKNRDKHTGG